MQQRFEDDWEEVTEAHISQRFQNDWKSRCTEQHIWAERFALDQLRFKAVGSDAGGPQRRVRTVNERQRERACGKGREGRS